MSHEIGPRESHSAQWGLGALLLGGIIILLFPMLSISFLALSVASWHSNSVDRGQLEAGVISSQVVVFSIFALDGVALLCGAWGLVRAIRHGQPFGLPFAGIATSVGALIVTVVLLQVTNYVIEDTYRLRKEHPRFKPADPATIQQVEAFVKLHPSLQPALDKAKEDGVITEMEADAILGRESTGGAQKLQIGVK